MRTTDLLGDMTCLEVVVATARTIYMSSIRVDKMMLEHQRMLILLEKLNMDATATKLLGITRLHDRSASIYYKEDILFMIQAPTALSRTITSLHRSTKTCFIAR